MIFLSFIILVYKVKKCSTIYDLFFLFSPCRDPSQNPKFLKLRKSNSWKYHIPKTLCRDTRQNPSSRKILRKSNPWNYKLGIVDHKFLASRLDHALISLVRSRIIIRILILDSKDYKFDSDPLYTSKIIFYFERK